MKKIALIFLLHLLFQIELHAQNPEAYKIFRADGKEVSYTKMVKELAKNQVILFGEEHDNPIAHWLQYKLTLELFSIYKTELAIGAEMIEMHQARYLEKYLQTGNLKYLTDSTKMWSNFYTDYLPILEMAQKKKICYFASNVTRKFASQVYKKGVNSLDSLTLSEKELICPLPFPFDSTLSQYDTLIKMGKEMHTSGLNFALSQAIKDATMAWNICQKLNQYAKIIHFNGTFHSDYHQGIEWYIQYYLPKTTIGTIATVTQKNINKLSSEYCKKADFILVVPEEMTKPMKTN
jgi:uncharacterized iron-regulated protein